MYWLPCKKVLVPTDFSEASTDAIHTALAMVEFGHCVDALHVVESLPPELVAAQLPPDVNPEQVEAARRDACQQRLTTFLTEHEFDGLCGTVCIGDPAEAITRYAKENDIDLIVMAAHGYGHSERLSIGSVTERILHNADCPVLVLRPDRRVPGLTPQVDIRENTGFAAALAPPNRITVPQPR